MKLKLITLFFIISCKVFSQSVSYYPFNSMLGISTNPNQKVWMDFRFQTNSYFSSLSNDISVEVNLKKLPKATYYTGLGAKLNYFNLIDNNKVNEGYFLNFGVRTRPFEKYKKVNVIFEISPYAGRNFDIGVFRSNFGLSYNFSN